MGDINGIINFDSLQSYRKKIELMNTSFKGRSNDFYAIVEGNGWIISCLNNNEKNKNHFFFSENQRYSIFFDGQIYNHLFIKKQLNTDKEFNSDAQLVLDAFIKWKSNALKFIKGAYCFVVWDHIEESLYAYRDKLGINPFYYYSNNGLFVFSSSIKAILNSGLIPKKIDVGALVNFFRFQSVIGNKTLIRGLNILEAGGGLKISTEQFQKKNYWSIIEEFRVTNGKKDEIHSIVREKVTNAVLSTFDTNTAVHIDGSLGSRIITSLISNNYSNKINTFSVFFDDGQNNQNVELRAKKNSTNHQNILINKDDVLANIHTVFNDLDNPFLGGLNYFLTSQVTKKKGIYNVISSLGSNELFAGNDLFKKIYDFKSKNWLSSFPIGFRTIFGSINSAIKQTEYARRLKEILKQQYFDIEYIYQFERQVFLDREIKQLMHVKLPINSVFELLNKTIGYGYIGYELPPLSRISVAEILTFLQSLKVREVSQVGVKNNLNIKLPFLDDDLVETIIGIPDRYKYPIVNNRLLINSFKEELCDDVLLTNRLNFPYKILMNKELFSFCEQGLSYLNNFSFINKKEIENLWIEFNKGNHVKWLRLFRLVLLGNWLKNNGIEE